MQTFALLYKQICNLIKFSASGLRSSQGPDPGDDPAQVRRCNESPQANWANAALARHQLSQLRPSPVLPLQSEADDDLGEDLADHQAALGQEPADSFASDQFPDLKFDYIFVNPPLNISNWGGEKYDSDPSQVYGRPPVGDANHA